MGDTALLGTALNNTSDLSQNNISNFSSTNGFPIRTIFAALYSFLFCFGEIGNFLVIFTLGFMCTHPVKAGVSGRLRHQNQQQHTIMFVIALSSTDSLSLLTLPFTIYGYFYRQWMFGHVVCKLYFLAEALNKVLSPLLLSALAFDRYMHVKHPTSPYIRSKYVTIIIILLLITIALSVMAPCIHYSGVYKADVEICSDQIPPEVLPFSVLLLFGVGFCAPSVLIMVFYSILVVSLGKTRGEAGRRRQRQRKVAFMLGLLSMFYTVCYTPYWMLTVIWPVFIITSRPSPTFHRLQLMVHVLPYINSSTNPVLYALLNTEIRRKARQLRRQRRAMKSVNIPLLAIQAMMPMLGMKYPAEKSLVLTKTESSDEDDV